MSGFAAAYTTGSAAAGIAAAIGAGIAMSLLFGFLTQTLVTNQVATGLALTLFGLGLSGLLGEPFTGLPGVKLSPVHIPGLSDLPFVGPVLFGHDGARVRVDRDHGARRPGCWRARGSAS